MPLDTSLPKTRAEARDIGKYMTGKPCSRGHLAPRLYSNCNCVECDREKRDARHARYREQHNARLRERYANDPDYRAHRDALRRPEYRVREAVQKRERYNTDPEYRQRILARRNELRSAAGQRDSQLKVHYGISLAEYDAMLEAQGGVCAICKCRPDHTLHVDHDHNSPTGRVRGLLCRGCNRGLGAFGDNPAALRNAANYLEASIAAR